MEYNYNFIYKRRIKSIKFPYNIIANNNTRILIKIIYKCNNILHIQFSDIRNLKKVLLFLSRISLFHDWFSKMNNKQNLSWVYTTSTWKSNYVLSIDFFSPDSSYRRFTISLLALVSRQRGLLSRYVW